MNVIKILAKEIGEYKKDTILTPLFMIGEVAMECLIPAVMAILIDHMYTESISMVIRYGALLITLALISLYCGANSARAGARAGAGFAKNLRRDLFYRVQDYSFKDIDEFSSASLVTRLTHDVSSVQKSFQMVMVGIKVGRGDHPGDSLFCLHAEHFQALVHRCASVIDPGQDMGMEINGHHHFALLAAA